MQKGQTAKEAPDKPPPQIQSETEGEILDKSADDPSKVNITFLSLAEGPVPTCRAALKPGQELPPGRIPPRDRH